MGILIRFKGGCGGEFLKTLLTDDRHLYHQASNRFTHHSAFNCLLNHGMDWSICDRYGIPHGTCWEELDEAVSDAIVGDLLDENPEDVICMHFIFRRNFNHGRVFRGYTMVDLYPSVGCYWITQALQIYKAAFSRVADDPPASTSDDPRYHLAATFRERNGWMPAWWGWVLREPTSIGLDDVSGFLDWACSSNEWEQTLSNTLFDGNEITISGEDFVVDTKAASLIPLFSSIGIEPSASVSERMGQWADRNLGILHRIGAAAHFGECLSHDQQKSLLKHLFLPIYEDLLFRD